MSIFKFEADTVIVDKGVQQIHPFSKIASHKDAEKYFAYIYYLCDWKSPYAQHDEDSREQILNEDILDGKKPTKLLKEGVEKYKALNKTDSSLLLQSARRSIRTLRDYFDNVDPESSDDPGKCAKDLINNLKSVGDIIKKIDEWEDQITKEKDKSTTRKGVVISKYNQG